MKNKLNIIFFLLVFVLINNNITRADNFTFNASEVNILNSGNTINAINGTATSVEDKIIIDAKKFLYDRNLLELLATEASSQSFDGLMNIKANQIKYFEKSSILHALGSVTINDLENGLIIKSQDIIYDVKKKIIRSSYKTIIKDDLSNTYSMENFNFDLNKKLIKIEKAVVSDAEKNEYKLNIAYLNLETKRLVGKDVFINLNNTSFQKDNEPRLYGKDISADNKKSILLNATFTPCKKNDTCPPWEMSAKKITHDKQKKTLNYDSAWLKIYDVPVLYFPKFFHPDPTVKRRSGFLMPSFTGTANTGSAFKTPYFYAIKKNKDLTISPRFYSTQKALIQTEYREVNEFSNHNLDFSIFADSNIYKGHFFSKSKRKINIENFDESEVKIDIQKSSSDTYLKEYKIKSPVIDSSSLLTSSIIFDAFREDLSLNLAFTAFEDLSRPKGDRFEYIYPNYTLSKKLDNNLKNLNGNLVLNSNGYQKNFNTNTIERVIINDFLYTSESQVSNIGIKNNFDFLIKNSNSDSRKSTRLKEGSNIKFDTIFQYNSSYPLKKELDNYINILKPIAAIKFSPSKTQNISSLDKRFDSTNIFALQRIPTELGVEGGTSMTYGLEFSKLKKTTNREIVAAKIAQSFRPKEDNKLPKRSSIGQKTSDIVSSIKFNPTDNFGIEYNTSLDQNLKDTNYDNIDVSIKINNFIGSFSYLNEKNYKDNKSYLSHESSYKFNDFHKIAFSGRENKKTNLTEFYNLIYEYRNDCLKAAVEYGKNFYTDGNIKPDETIFFKLSIVPFGAASTPEIYLND